METAKETKRASFEEALQGLRSPRTWCQAADRLVALGDRRALLALLDAYETPIEGGKRCLLEAMDRLGATEAAAELFTGDARQRAQAVRLMELFASDRHLPVLMRAISDPSEAVRIQAREALVNQERTERWRAAMVKLRQDADEET